MIFQKGEKHEQVFLFPVPCFLFPVIALAQNGLPKSNGPSSLEYFYWEPTCKCDDPTHASPHAKLILGCRYTGDKDVSFGTLTINLKKDDVAGATVEKTYKLPINSQGNVEFGIAPLLSRGWAPGDQYLLTFTPFVGPVPERSVTATMKLSKINHENDAGFTGAGGAGTTEPGRSEEDCNSDAIFLGGDNSNGGAG